MKVVFGLNQKQNLYKILIYTAHLFDEKEIEHSKLIYQFLDKKKQSYRSNLYENFDQVIYMIHPFEGPYTFDFENHSLTLQFPLLDAERIYPYIEKDVYDTVFRLEIINTENNQDIIEKFIKSAFQYTAKFFETDQKNIFVYQYDEQHGIWDKYTDMTKRNIETIYLPCQQKEKILKDLENFLSPVTRANYEKFGIPYHKTYCFYGPPGSGKTSLIHALCSVINKHVCIYRFSGQTKDQNLATALKWLPNNSVFVLEDIDCIIKDRNDVKGNITFSGLLNILDGLSTIDCLVTFITTNHFIELDTAMKRPGRIDYILEFSYMTKDQIYKMLEIFYPHEKEDFDIIYNEIKGMKMTVSHLQKFLFSLYPNGNIKKNVAPFIQEYLKYYVQSDSKLYI